MDAIIYKVLQKKEWDIFQNHEEYEGAPIDLQDGYIHFSTAQQLQETVTKHFKNTGDLMLLAIDVTSLDSKSLKWEPSRGGALFPHLYGCLKRSAVAQTWVLTQQADGGHSIPADIMKKKGL